MPSPPSPLLPPLRSYKYYRKKKHIPSLNTVKQHLRGSFFVFFFLLFKLFRSENRTTPGLSYTQSDNAIGAGREGITKGGWKGGWKGEWKVEEWGGEQTNKNASRKNSTIFFSSLILEFFFLRSYTAAFLCSFTPAGRCIITARAIRNFLLLRPPPRPGAGDDRGYYCAPSHRNTGVTIQ